MAPRIRVETEFARVGNWPFYPERRVYFETSYVITNYPNMSKHPGLADPISNDDLQPGDVPSGRAEWSLIVRFAQTFNGFVQMGGFHLCADVANHRRECQSLSDLRACLFFEYRRHNHFGYPPDDEKLQYIYELLDRIRDYVAP